MLPEAAVTAPLVLAGVLVASASGKLRAPGQADDAWRELGVPAMLRRPIVVRAHPWAELVLAVLLLAAGGWLGRIVAVAVLALMLAYLGLVLRALRAGSDAHCACFGARADEVVTKRTAWRNAWFVVLAVLGVVWSFQDESPLQSVIRAGALGWVVSLLAAALTAWFVVAPTRRSDAIGPRIASGHLGTEETEDTEDELDYVRVTTPHVPVTVADGSSLSLRDLAGQRAQLLVYVSETCGSCHDVIGLVDGWRLRLPALDVRLMFNRAPEDVGRTSLAEPQTLHDPQGYVFHHLALGGTPSAVLLGVDGQLAGGPVGGTAAIQVFVDDIEAELRKAQEADGTLG